MMTEEDFLLDWAADTDTLLVHTSGSTGKPKPMWVEKHRMLNSARITCDFLGLRCGENALLCMSLDYIAGKMMMVRSIERGLRLFCVKPSGHPLSDESLSHAGLIDFTSKKSHVMESADATASYLDFVAMVPMQVYNSLQVPIERKRLSQIKHLIIGGGAIDDALAVELRKLPGAVWSTYGMTETLSHIALRRLNGAQRSEWYEPFSSVDVRTNEEGCLVIEAPLVCEQTLVTNDIVEIRKENTGKTFFRIKGRKDNVICSGGIKIQIEEVEEQLRPYLDAPFMIVKQKDEKFGEIAVLLSEASSAKFKEVTNICCEHLPKYWMPKKFVHLDKLPLTETGKPKRNYLL